MKGLEVIRVQVASHQEDQQVRMEKRLFDLRREVGRVPECTGLIAFEVFRQTALPGSFAIHLLWDSAVPDPLGSVLGWNLREALKEFGLVNHSVWLAMSPKARSSWNPGGEDV